MQKSQQGLLQSLLREIYGQCPELVPITCPSRWSRYYEIGATWTLFELSEAFRTLSHQRFLDLKFCIFVDGVDEYDGEDYTHFIEVLKNLMPCRLLKYVYLADSGTSSYRLLAPIPAEDCCLKIITETTFKDMSRTGFK